MNFVELVSILDALDIDDVENQYIEFYKDCEKYAFVGNQADDLFKKIYGIYENSSNPVIKSYSLLFLGAAFDAAKIDERTCITAIDFLVSELDGLKNFELKDDSQNFIHYMNHSIFFAESILESSELRREWHLVLSHALLNAYLRSDILFGFNEDVVFAGFLLNAHLSDADFNDIVLKLYPVEPNEQDDIFEHTTKESNKRSLWTTMFAANYDLKKYEPACFSTLIEKIALPN